MSNLESVFISATTATQPGNVASPILRDDNSSDGAPVLVEIHVSGEFTDVKDANVSGLYVAEVDPKVPVDKVASAALDAFHSTVPVNNRDDFEFKVVRDGAVLPQDPGHELYALAHSAVVIHRASE